MLQYGLIVLLAWGASPEDLLKNGGFEQIVGAKPAAWDFYLMPQPGSKAVVDGEVAYDGDYSIMIRNAREYETDPCNNWSQNITETLAGKRLLVAGYIKTENTASAAIWLQCWRSSPLGVIQVTTTEDEYSASGLLDWTLVQMAVDVPSGTDFVTLRCVLKGKGAAWFDNVSVVETEPESEKKPPSPTVAPFKSEAGPDEAPEDEGGSVPDGDIPMTKELPAIYEPIPPPSPLASESSPFPAPTDTAKDISESAEALTDAIQSLKTANETLAGEVGRLQEEIRVLRERLETLKEDSLIQDTAPPGAPVGPTETKGPEEKTQKRRVPPLVPHGYNLEELP